MRLPFAGRLKCIGTGQHLKGRFGKSFTMEIALGWLVSRLIARFGDQYNFLMSVWLRSHLITACKCNTFAKATVPYPEPHPGADVSKRVCECAELPTDEEKDNLQQNIYDLLHNKPVSPKAPKKETEMTTIDKCE